MFNFTGERFPDGTYRQLLDKRQANEFAKGAYEMVYEKDGTPRLPLATHRLQGTPEIARLHQNVGAKKIDAPCKLSAVELEARDGMVEVIARTLNEPPAELQFKSPWTAIELAGPKASFNGEKRTGRAKRKYTKQKAQTEAAPAPMN